MASQETISIDDYYDKPHSFDKKQWFQKHAIYRTVSRFIGDNDKLVQCVDMIHDENGLPIREIFLDDNGQERTTFYNYENSRMIYIGFDKNLVVKFRFDIQMSSWPHLEKLIPILKDPISRKALGIRKIIHISTHPTGHFFPEEEYIFSDQGILLSRIEKSEDGTFSKCGDPSHVA